MRKENLGLTKSEIERYKRQIAIKEIGKQGQLKLKGAKVVICGAGGLGTIVGLYLTAAGIGRLAIIDKEKAELSNLNRQILYGSGDLKRFKAEVLSGKLSVFSPKTKIEGISEKIKPKLLRQIIKNAHVVIDCLDNWPSRYLLNKICFEEKIPLIHGAVERFSGQIITILPNRGPCLRCLFLNQPKKKITPILGATAGIIGSLQAMEAIKIIVGIENLLVSRMLLFDGESATLEEIKIKQNPECSICSNSKDKR